jgi:hypothetical protein
MPRGPQGGGASIYRALGLGAAGRRAGNGALLGSRGLGI